MDSAADLPRLAPGVRPATADDLVAVLAMIVELADYERSVDEVAIGVEQLHDALFGPTATASCLVATAAHDVVGFALYFGYFSTWQGRGLYLEDLYVRPAHRGTGLGKALLASLAGVASARGYARLEWAVLDWNRPAIDFYERLGAVAQDEWTRFRLSGTAHADLAAATG